MGYESCSAAGQNKCCSQSLRRKIMEHSVAFSVCAHIHVVVEAASAD